MAQGMGLKDAMADLGGLGVEKVIYQRDAELERYGGEFFCQGLADLIARRTPSHVLMAQSPETLDLAARLAARLEAPLHHPSHGLSHRGGPRGGGAAGGQRLSV